MRFSFTSMRVQNSAASGTSTSPSFVSIAKQWHAAWEFDIAHGAERRRRARLPHFAPDQIADEVASRGELRALLDRHLNFEPAQAFRGFDIVYARKMKDGLAAPARRKPAALHANSAGARRDRRRATLPSASVNARENRSGFPRPLRRAGREAAEFSPGLRRVNSSAGTSIRGFQA